MKKILFICRQGLDRSRTAAEMFSTLHDSETKWAGSNDEAPFPLKEEDIEWANIIFTMEKSQEKELRKKFKDALDKKYIICLRIPDIFSFNDEQLKRTLNGRAGKYLRGL